jgi:hypothetical protein
LVPTHFFDTVFFACFLSFLQGRSQPPSWGVKSKKKKF